MVRKDIGTESNRISIQLKDFLTQMHSGGVLRLEWVKRLDRTIVYSDNNFCAPGLTGNEPMKH